MNIRSVVLAIVVSCIAQTAALAQSQLSIETSKAMEVRISALMAKVNSTQSAVANGRKILQENQPGTILDAASRETEGMLEKYKEIIKEFEAGGEIDTVLQKADKELGVIIEKFNANVNQREAAKVLEGSRVRFAGLEKKRDVLLQEANKQIRLLEANKDRIEAWIVVRKYQEIEGALVAMFDGLGDLNKKTKEFTDDLAKADKLPTE